jgi:hypothetical protein
MEHCIVKTFRILPKNIHPYRLFEVKFSEPKLRNIAITM